MPTELTYDPVRVFGEVFSDHATADDLADLLTCREVNALAGLLANLGSDHAVKRWLAVHRSDCDHPERH